MTPVNSISWSLILELADRHPRLQAFRGYRQSLLVLMRDKGIRGDEGVQPFSGSGEIVRPGYYYCQYVMDRF